MEQDSWIPQNAICFQSLNKDDILKVACAIVNDKGGVIFVGVDPNHHIVTGISEADFIDLQKSLNDCIFPSLPFIMSKMQMEDMLVAVVSIWEGSNKSYSYNSKIYVKKGDAAVVASAQDINSLATQRSNIESSWERMVQGDATIEDINKTIVERLRTSMISDGRFLETQSQEDLLRKLGFLKRDMFTNAALVVLGKEPSSFFPQTRIRISVYGKEHQLQEVRLFDSNLVDAVDGIVSFVYAKYPRRIEISGMTRTEIEPLPLVALREGILNACIHRIYDQYNSFVCVNIYPNYLEIINTGTLLEGIKIEDFGKTHSSMLRNPDIANAFYCLRYIEMAGSGILRIIDECIKNGCKKPTWIVKDGLVILHFDVSCVSTPAESTSILTDLIKNLSLDSSVQEALQLIVKKIEQNGSIKTVEVQDLTRRSYASAKRYMQLLKDAQLIEYQGGLKTGSWHLIR